MSMIIILFVVGSVLLAAEIFLPGAIAGILGGLALLAGSVLSFGEFGATGGVLASSGALLLLGFIIYFELVVLPKTNLGRSMTVTAVVDSISQPPVAPESVVGQLGEALTPLAPSGHVLVGGCRYEAFCRSGYAAKGASLRVVSVDNFRLVVTQP